MTDMKSGPTLRSKGCDRNIADEMIVLTYDLAPELVARNANCNESFFYFKGYR